MWVFIKNYYFIYNTLQRTCLLLTWSDNDFLWQYKWTCVYRGNEKVGTWGKLSMFKKWSSHIQFWRQSSRWVDVLFILVLCVGFVCSSTVHMSRWCSAKCGRCCQTAWLFNVQWVKKCDCVSLCFNEWDKKICDLIKFVDCYDLYYRKWVSLVGLTRNWWQKALSLFSVKHSFEIFTP